MQRLRVCCEINQHNNSILRFQSRDFLLEIPISDGGQAKLKLD